jgi:hypothetical protein
MEGLRSAGRRPPLVVAFDAATLASATAQRLADDPRRGDLGTRARSFEEEHHSAAAYARGLEQTNRAALGVAR